LLGGKHLQTVMPDYTCTACKCWYIGPSATWQRAVQCSSEEGKSRNYRVYCRTEQWKKHMV